MAQFGRIQSPNIQSVERIAFLILSLCIPLSMLYVPVLAAGAEYELCDEEIELCEEFVAASDHKRVRIQRVQVSCFSWKTRNSVACCAARCDQSIPRMGHRLKHDLLAPLTC